MTQAPKETRFKTHLIDSIICTLIVFILYAIAVAIIDFDNKDEIFFSYYVFFFLGIRTLYCFFFELYFARTIGKAVTKTKVLTLEDNFPDLKTTLIRSLCRLIPFNEFSFLAGANWHDSISKTKVVIDN